MSFLYYIVITLWLILSGLSYEYAMLYYKLPDNTYNNKIISKI